MFLPLTQATLTNLISVECGHWWRDQDCEPAPIETMIINYTNTYNGEPSWQIPLTATNYGIDHNAIPCEPNDHIIYSCYIMTTDSTVQNEYNTTFAGGRIGLDMYGSSGAARGISTPNGEGSATWFYNTCVEFGTYTWTQVTMEFTVPDTYVSNQGDYNGNTFTPTYFIPWIQTCSAVNYETEQGTAWYSGFTLYVYPETPTTEDLYGNVWGSNLLLLGAITISAGIIYKFTEKWHQY